MKKISSKTESNRTVNIITVIVNSALFLGDYPSDICEWVVKAIEVFAFIVVLISSWKFSISTDAPIKFSQALLTVKFFNLKNK